MTRRRPSLLVPLLVATLTAAPAAVHGADGHADPAASAPATLTYDARTYFTDTEVVDQHDRHLRFFSDLMADRVVVLNVVYARCEDACPLITAKLREVADKLGERFGREVFFISISTDPERDSPAALLSFAEKHRADLPGWHFVTGHRPDIERILGRLGQLASPPGNHSTLLIAGDVPGKRWSKIQPQAPAWAIAERLRQLTAAPTERAALPR